MTHEEVTELKRQSLVRAFEAYRQAFANGTLKTVRRQFNEHNNDPCDDTGGVRHNQ